jgi:hypothetical protein
MTIANDEEPRVLVGEDPSPTARSQIWISRARALVSLDELAIVASLLSLCVVVRVWWLTPVDIFGDAGQKWLFARQLAYANDFHNVDWTHHMARLGINLPVYLLQRLLGTAPKYYYVVPVAAYTLQVLFLYLVGRRLGGRASGVVGALFAIFYTGMIRSSSQLLPDGIAGSVVLMTCYCLLRFYDAEGPSRLRWLLLVGLTFAWSYACKESNLLLFPGVLLCVWLGRRSLKEASIFAGFMAAYGALETAGFWLFTKHRSRFAIVQEAPEYKPIRFMQLFDRYQILEFSWQMLLWLWVASALWLATKREKAFWPVLLLPASFLFFLTFTVRHVDPLVPWIGNKSRYLAVVAPFFVLGIALFFTALARQVWSIHRRPVLSPLVGWARREAALVVIVLCALLGGLTWWSGQGENRAQRELRLQARVLNDAYRRNLPIIDPAPGARGIKTAYEVLLDDALLTQADVAPKGWLPDANDALHRLKYRRRRVSYLLPNVAAYGGRHGVQKMIERNCAVRIVTRGSTARISPREKLPESCKAPGGELPRP